MKAVLVALALLPLGAHASECSTRVSEMAAAAEFSGAVRDASIASRRQAQDFKNAILRNGASDHAVFTRRLEEHMADYRRSLDTLGNHAARLREEQSKIEASYREAVAMLDAKDPSTVFKADAKTKGVDVPTFRTLESLMESSGRAYGIAKKAAADSCR